MDVELAVILGIFWLASLARVIVAFGRGGSFGVEPTLALGAAVLVPFLAAPAIRDLARARRRGA